MTNTRQQGVTRRRAMRQALAGSAAALSPAALGARTATPAQVEGPFYPDAPVHDKDLDLTRINGRADGALGEIIAVTGSVRDTQGRPLAGARVDIWQANHVGRYRHSRDLNPAPLDPNFQGWGVIAADTSGAFRFKTVKPGPYKLSYLGGRGWRCRHIHFKISHPDASALTTQMYFKGDPLIATDQVLAAAPESLRHLLIADVDPAADSPVPLYRFDIVLADA